MIRWTKLEWEGGQGVAVWGVLVPEERGLGAFPWASDHLLSLGRGTQWCVHTSLDFKRWVGHGVPVMGLGDKVDEDGSKVDTTHRWLQEL